MAEVKRLDVFLVEAKIAKSRQRAKELIENGQIFINNIPIFKPSTPCLPQTVVELRGETLKYVGRGGIKLEKALEFFGINVLGNIAIDIGASTGGFTDCLLQNGAEKVYAVDVGTSQLHETLRHNPQVVVMENTDIRTVTPQSIGQLLDIAVCDLSFISLKLVFANTLTLLKDGGYIIALIKPQFEVGKGNVPKTGVIKSPKTHEKVLNEVLEHVKQNNFTCVAITHSPIKGGSGNIEYLALFKKENSVFNIDIKSVVALGQKM